MKYISILFTAMLAIACKNKVETIFPIQEPITESVYASGVVKSENQYQVYSTVSGIVEKWLVEEGDSVKVGMPLLRLSNEASKLSVQNAELSADFNNYESNKSKLQELMLNADFAKQKYKNDSLLYARQELLWRQQVGSQVDFEQRQLAFQNSKTAYETAILKMMDLRKQLEFASRQSKKSLQLSQKQESDFTIRSDIKGKVYNKLKEQGELATPQTPLAVIGDANSFLLSLQVDEYDIIRIKLGQQVWVALDSYKGQRFEARINKVFPYMNERTKSFLVEAQFVQQPKVLYPNLTIEANIVIQTKTNAITVPRNYVTEDGYVLKKGGERVKVQTGLKDYRKIEIISGISVTDELQKP